MAEDRSAGEDPQFSDLVLSEDGIVDLTDQLTGYMTEIELAGLPDIIGQVLDDFLDQCGGMPENLADAGAFEQITRNQLAVTLAYQLGRLEGRAPQVVRLLIEEAIKKWGTRSVDDSGEISDKDLETPKELVYPRLRRLEYTGPEQSD